MGEIREVCVGSKHGLLVSTNRTVSGLEKEQRLAGLLRQQYQAVVVLEESQAMWGAREGLIWIYVLPQYGASILGGNACHPSTVCPNRPVEAYAMLLDHIAERRHGSAW